MKSIAYGYGLLLRPRLFEVILVLRVELKSAGVDRLDDALQRTSFFWCITMLEHSPVKSPKAHASRIPDLLFPCNQF